MKPDRRAGARIACVCVLSITVAACGGSQTPSPSLTPTSTGVATASPSALPTASASPSPAPTERIARSIVLTDPFAGCKYTGQGKLTRSATYEPSAAIGGSSGARLIVALYYQGYVQRTGMNAGLGFVLASSKDGGETWANHPLGFGPCAGNPGYAVSNGRVSVGPDGTSYVATAAGNGVDPIRLVLTASPDGGASWTPARFESMRGDICHADEPSVTADPTRSGYAYAVWVDACWPQHSYLGISTTSDGGKSWSTPRDIRLAGYNWVNWPTIVADPASPATLRLVFTDCKNGTSKSYTLAMTSSTDGGASWGKPVVIAQGPGGYGPDPSAAMAPDGSIYVVWDMSEGISMSRSTDGGRTWSEARTVTNVNDRPSLAINSRGTLAIAFEPHSMIVSTDGGQSFSHTQALGDVDMPAGFAGDYTIAAFADGADFHAVFECVDKKLTRTCFW